MLHFPSSPNVDDIYEGPNIKWRWDGARWVRLGGGGAGVIVSPTPPPNPRPNTLWFNSSNGALFIWHDDGNSTQWVEITSEGGGSDGNGSINPADLISIDASNIITTGSDNKLYATGGGGNGGGGEPSPTTGTEAWVRQTSPTINQPKIMGVTDGSNAASGEVGEYFTSNAYNIAPVVWGGANNDTTFVNQIPAGDWYLTCWGWFSKPSSQLPPSEPFMASIQVRTATIIGGTTNGGNFIISSHLSQINIQNTWHSPTFGGRLNVSVPTTLTLRINLNTASSPLQPPPSGSLASVSATVEAWRMR